MKKEGVIIGLIITIYALTLIEPPLKKINETRIGERVRIQGIISDYYRNKELTSFTITDGTGNIKTIIFKETILQNEMNVTVTGRVKEYKEEKEMTGVRVKKNT